MLFTVILLLIIGVFLGYKYIYNKPHPDYAHLTADFKLNAMDLFQQFKESPDIYGEKYNGKMIELSGNIKTIETADSLVIAVFAFEQGLFGDEGIRCTFLPDHNEMAQELKSGTHIMLKGFCAGYNQTDVILEKCSLINK